MTLEDLVTSAVRLGVHQALDERDLNALPDYLTFEQIEAYYTRTSPNGKPALKASTLRALAIEGKLKTVKPGKEYLTTPQWLKQALGLELEVKA